MSEFVIQSESNLERIVSEMNVELLSDEERRLIRQLDLPGVERMLATEDSATLRDAMRVVAQAVLAKAPRAPQNAVSFEGTTPEARVVIE